KRSLVVVSAGDDQGADSVRVRLRQPQLGRERHLARCRPFGSPKKSSDESWLLHRADFVTEGGAKHPTLAVRRGENKWFSLSCPARGGVVVRGCDDVHSREQGHSVVKFIRGEEAAFHALRDRMINVADSH